LQEEVGTDGPTGYVVDAVFLKLILHDKVVSEKTYYLMDYTTIAKLLEDKYQVSSSAPLVGGCHLIGLYQEPLSGVYGLASLLCMGYS